MRCLCACVRAQPHPQANGSKNRARRKHNTQNNLNLNPTTPNLKNRTIVINNQQQQTQTAAPAKPSYDFSGETLYWEGGPAKGDLLFNIALGTTLVWLPLTFAAVGRTVFLKYKFTDRRLSVSDTFPAYGAPAPSSLVWRTCVFGALLRLARCFVLAAPPLPAAPRQALS